MEVVNTKRFEVVFTFVNHPFFGMVVEANAIQLLENGNPSLTFQRIRKQKNFFQNQIILVFQLPKEMNTEKKAGQYTNLFLWQTNL